MLKRKDLANNLSLCSKCHFHYPLTAHQRIDLLSDRGSFKELDSDMVSTNILGFSGYEKTLEAKKKSTKLKDAVVCGFCTLNKQAYGIAVMDFRFMGASMGSVVGEKITNLVEKSTKRGTPVLIVTDSGGARMQEGSLSLMQMAKTSAALSKFHDKGLFYLSVLTNPTTGGVTASFATLGDVIIAEPNALIAFAGPRVVEQTIRQKLPSGAQRSEFVLEHGLIDAIVKRSDLKAKISSLLSFFNLNQREKNVSFSNKVESGFINLCKFNLV